MKTAVVETPWGPVWYIPHDAYVGRSLDLYHEFSMGEALLFKELVPPDRDVVEVGANIGAHTVCLARLTREAVYAFEPQPALFWLLKKNTMRFSNVLCHGAALGDAHGEMYLPRLDYDQPANFGGVSLLERPVGWDRAPPRIEVCALDELLPDIDLGFLKVDVEGMEIEVVVGARGLITRHKPRLYIENDRPEKSLRLITLLASMGYRLYWHLPPLFRPDNYAKARDNAFPSIISVNLIGLHRDDPVEPPYEDPYCLGPVMGVDDTYQRAYARLRLEVANAEQVEQAASGDDGGSAREEHAGHPEERGQGVHRG